MTDGEDRAPDDPYTVARLRMVALQLESRGIRDRLTLDAMRRVPREEFVPDDLRHRAYEDGALAIGGGQTISQPFIVARMTEALELGSWMDTHPGQRPQVLDVGTGSGYQAAVLAELGADVISIEVDPQLSSDAAARLAGLGYAVTCVVGDGSAGDPERSPYAGILVAAACPDVPPPLVEQLADGGRLVLPIGPREHQQLSVVTRRGANVEIRDLEPAVFVPLVGRYGYG